MLVLIGAVGLLAVFVLIANYVSSVSKQVGDKISIVELTAPLPAYHQVSGGMLREVSVPQKWAPPNAVTDPGLVLGQVSPVDLPAGERLQRGMLMPLPALTAGRRAMSVNITPETGGQLQLEPGDLVDVVASYQASGAARNRSELVIPSAPVLIAAQLTGATGNGTVPITLLLTPDQELKLAYAESFSEKLTLGKVGVNSTPVNPPAYSPNP